MKKRAQKTGKSEISRPCVYDCWCVHGCMWRPQHNQRAVLQVSHTFCVESESSIAPEISKQGSLPAQQAQRSTCHCHPSNMTSSVYNKVLACFCFQNRDLELKLRSLALQDKCFPEWAATSAWNQQILKLDVRIYSSQILMANYKRRTWKKFIVSSNIYILMRKRNHSRVALGTYFSS